MGHVKSYIPTSVFTMINCSALFLVPSYLPLYPGRSSSYIWFSNLYKFLKKWNLRFFTFFSFFFLFLFIFWFQSSIPLFYIILEFKLIQKSPIYLGIHYCVTKKDITIRTNNNSVEQSRFLIWLKFIYTSFTILLHLIVPYSMYLSLLRHASFIELLTRITFHDIKIPEASSPLLCFVNVGKEPTKFKNLTSCCDAKNYK